MQRRLHRVTPLNRYPEFPSLWFKMESYQPVGSFKIRGIGALCQHAVANGYTHLVSSSGGNAGFATAYSAHELRVKATVVVPTITSEEAKKRMASYGAHVVTQGDSWMEAHEHSLEIVASCNGFSIHPFDNPVIWKGHETLIDEVIEEIGRPSRVILSVGGGGLFIGLKEALIRHGLDDVEVWCVETDGAASLHASLTAGTLVTLPKITSVAITLGARRVAERAFLLAQSPSVRSLVVTDYEALEACNLFAYQFQTLVEPACGAALAVAYNERHNHPDSTVVVACGGIGVIGTF
jgi:L-serine/L-threonine ammonia-lyase